MMHNNRLPQKPLIKQHASILLFIFSNIICFSKTNRKNTKNVCLKLTLWKISEVKMFEITLEKNLNTKGKKDVYKDLK